MNICYNPYSLDGKLILVTGASSGIGRATAIECAKLGAKLIISGRNEARLSETLNILEGTGHTMLCSDLTDQKDCCRLVDSLSSLDGVVISIGITALATIPYTTPTKLNNVFDVNFFAPVEFTRLLLKNKKIINGGSIVCLSSVGGNFSFDVAHGIYGASKAALSSWMKFVAKEAAVKKIRVNCICPGMTETNLAVPDIITAEQLETDKLKYPLGRYALPHEIALAVVYMLSDASKWVTGTNFLIDGGLSLT